MKTLSPRRRHQPKLIEKKVALASLRVALSLAIASILFSGCSTALPPIGASSPSAISYHYNLQNAGIYGALYCQGQFAGFLVDDEYISDYKKLLPGPANLHAPADPFSSLSNPMPDYTIYFTLKGQKLSWPLTNFILSPDLWPIQSGVNAVTAEGLADYPALQRASWAIPAPTTPTPAQPARK